MKSFVLAAAAGFVVAACASAPEEAKPMTLDQMLIGKWTCVTSAEGMNIKATLDYATGGKSTYVTHVNGDAGGMKIEMTGNGDGVWAVQPDGKLTDTIKTLKVTAGKLNGSDVPPALLQGMVEGMLVGQASTSTVTMSGGAMVLTDEEDVVTNCAR
jgi:hypothetical protein